MLADKGGYERYHSFFWNNPNAIYSIDLDGIVIDFNPAFHHLLGYAPERLRSMHYLEFVAPGHRQRARLRFELLGSGNAMDEIEMDLLRSDGTVIAAMGSVQPIVRAKTVIGYHVFLKDVTDQRRAEQALHETQVLLESVFNYTADAISVYSLDGTIVKVNAAYVTMFGFPERDLVGRTFPTTPVDELAKIEQLHRSVTSGERPFAQYEGYKLHRDGHRVDVVGTISPMPDENGKIVGLSHVIRDVTELRKTQDLLIQSEKLSVVGQLAAGLAHEIRNPLTSLTGFVQLLQNDSQHHPKHLSYLSIMQSELKRINWIVSEFLVTSKPQAAQFDRVNLVEAVNDVVALLQTQTLLHYLVVDVDVDEDIPFVRADETQMKQVFLNIIKNACEASPKNGHVHIQVRENRDFVVMSCSDEGPGIAKEQLARVGEPFFTTKETGTGLGMMVSYQIVERHGGRIEIDSEPNRGTTMLVYIPIHV